MAIYEGKDLMRELTQEPNPEEELRQTIYDKKDLKGEEFQMAIHEEKDLKGELTQEPEPEEEFRMAIYDEKNLKG